MRYVIIGNGVSGNTAAQEIRKYDRNGEITILAAEPYPFYSRIRLIDFLADRVALDKLILRDLAWHEAQNIRLLLATPATAIDPVGRTVTSADNRRFPFDRLLIATGGLPRLPMIAGLHQQGVFTLRSLDDGLAIKDFAAGHRKVVVIGGGVLGLEVGNSLLARGNEVTVVEAFDRLLPRQLDRVGASLLERQLTAMGLNISLGAAPQEIVGENRVTGVLLDNDREVAADMVIVSAGIKPAIELPRAIGLEIGQGVIVNDHLETSIAGIYAAGDLIEHRRKCYGIWPAASKQGEIAGRSMAGEPAAYDGTVIANSLKVVGISLFAAGEIDAESKYESFVAADHDKQTYRKIVIHQGRIIGAILYGDLSLKARLVKAVELGIDVTPFRRAFGRGDFSGLP